VPVSDQISERPVALGKLISIHGTSPAFLQRAAIVAVLSFVFFLAMLAAFYVRQHIGYFVLSTAFLVVHLFTMIGWWMQKRNAVKLYENGLTYKKTTVLWEDADTVTTDAGVGLTIAKLNKETLVIPSSIDGIGKLAAHVRARLR